jgi:FdhD protein
LAQAVRRAFMQRLPLSSDTFRHLPSPSVEMPRRDQDGLESQRTLAEECPIALVYNGTTAAVVMATPSDLRDFALGFSLTEGIIDDVAELQSLDVIPGPSGIELRMWLAGASERRFRSRQRRLVGPTGCGLCGIESLADAARPTPRLTRQVKLRTGQVEQALHALSDAQTLNRATHATHAAGFFYPDQQLVALREDVGRHNALDKLAGALGSSRIPAHGGAIVLTSRVSIELVQKAAAIGCPMLIAMSAPTALAVRTAEACGMTLIAIARGHAFEVFSHPDGIAG